MSSKIRLFKDNAFIWAWRCWSNICDINVEKMSESEITDLVFKDIDDDGRSAEVALVFGNYLLQDDRVDTAVELYKEGRVKKLLLLGGSGGMSDRKKENRTEAKLMAKRALRKGVRRKDLILEEDSTSTYQNCRNASVILRDLYGDDIDRLVLVSDTFHIKRCKELCEKVLPKNIEYTLVASDNKFVNEENWAKSKLTWTSAKGMVLIGASQMLWNRKRKKWKKNSDKSKRKVM